MNGIFWIISTVVLLAVIALAVWDIRRNERWLKTATPEQVNRSIERHQLFSLIASIIAIFLGLFVLLKPRPSVPENPDTNERNSRSQEQDPPQQQHSCSEIDSVFVAEFPPDFPMPAWRFATPAPCFAPPGIRSNLSAHGARVIPHSIAVFPQSIPAICRTQTAFGNPCCLQELLP